MKLYYLLISIFCVRLIGLSYFITFLFLGNLLLHLIDRIPFYLLKYPNNFYLCNVEKCANYLKKNIVIHDNNDYYYKLISSDLLIPVVNLYNKAEYFYLIILDETLLMFGNLAFSAANKLMMNKIKLKETRSINTNNNINERLLIDSSSEECETEIQETEEDFDNLSIIDKIKKKNNIPNVENSDKFKNMSLSDLNKMNLVLSSLTGTLNGLISDIKVDKEKTI